MSHRKRSQPQIDPKRVVALHLHGLTVKAIVERYGSSRREISKIIKDAGHQPDCRRRDYAGGGSVVLMSPPSTRTA
jgi:hypothetical protein